MFWPFPFMFLFSAGLKSRQRTRFLLVIKGRGPLQIVVSFLFLFAGDSYVLFRCCLVRRPFCIFSFCFLPIFGRELSFFLLFSSEGEDGDSHPRSRFRASWVFGSKLVEWLDMIYVRVLVWSAVQG